jgi:hypothetical protein
VLPSDTYRELITSITAVLLPFVTYLLTLLRIMLPRHKNFPPTVYVNVSLAFPAIYQLLISSSMQFSFVTGKEPLTYSMLSVFTSRLIF